MFRFAKCVVALALIAVPFTLGASARAAAPRALGAEVPISRAAYMQGLPALAWNETAGQYLVVWQDGRNKFYEGWNIYGVRVGADGAPIGSEFRISVPTSETDQVRPAVAWNGEANEYLVVWEDYRLGETRGADVYGRRIRADGVPASGDFRISGATGMSDQGGPALAWNGEANEYLVVWEDYRAQDTRSADIYGRLLGPTGTALTPDRRLSAITTWSGQIAPAVVYNATADEYFVVWEDWRSDLSGGSIFGRRVTAAGAALGRDLRVSSAAGNMSLQPALAWNATANEYFVVWEDQRNLDARNIDVFGRRLNGADATPLERERALSGASALADDIAPSVAWSVASNEYLVAWQDARALDSRGLEVYGRRVGSDGRPKLGDFRLSGPPATLDETECAVAWGSSADTFLVVWRDGRNLGGSSTGEDIYGRIVPA